MPEGPAGSHVMSGFRAERTFGVPSTRKQGRFCNRAKSLKPNASTTVQTM